MALGETGDWAGAVERITNLIKTGEDPLGGELPEGYGSQRLLEAFAREIAAEHDTDLGLTLPETLAGYSAAMQGGFLTPILTRWKPPKYLPVPVVVQFIGIAAAGQKKSTLLAEVAAPLKAALDGIGAEHRSELVDKWRDAAIKANGDDGVATNTNQPDWLRVYAGGLCVSSTTDQGTPEGLRKRMAAYGGHRAILTAEPDVLRDVSAYAKGSGGGSLRNFLSGWDQEAIEADRVSGDVHVIEPSLPCVIMVQPESFVKYTMGGADGTDDFVDRGVFSRMLLWAAKPQLAGDGFAGDLEEWDPEAWAEDGLAHGGMVDVLRDKLSDSMVEVVRRTNPYRVSKGVLHAYLEKPPDWPMPKPPLHKRVQLGLDGAEGHKAAARVQRMRSMIMESIEAMSAERPDYGAVLYPFAQRFTSHVMRLAAVQSVAEAPGDCQVVDTDHIEDVATRVMPWLWAGWWRLMADRLESNAATLVEANATKNYKGTVLTGAVRLADAFVKLEKKHGISAMGGFPRSEVIKMAKLAFAKQERTKVHGQLESQFMELLADGAIELSPEQGSPSAIGKVVERYRLTEQGRQLTT